MISDRIYWGGAPATAELDCVQEFEGKMSSTAAKMKRPAMAIVTTRGGSTACYGFAFETARSIGPGVVRHRQDLYGKLPQFIRNEFGFSFAGPFVLAKLHSWRNRTFFFFNDEGFRQRATTTASTTVHNGEAASRVQRLSRRIQSVHCQLRPVVGKATWSRAPDLHTVILSLRNSAIDTRQLQSTLELTG